jgi:hypothetical protein
MRRRSSRIPRGLLFLAPVLAICGGAAIAAGDPFADGKQALEAALRAKDEAKAREAIGAIAGEDSERAVKALAAAAAAGRDLDLYRDLVAGIGRMRSDPAVKEAIRIAGGERDWTIRFLFVEALAAIDRPDARQALFAAFEDRNESVATNAMRACRNAGMKAAIRPLIDACERYEKKDRGGKMQLEALRALSAMTGEGLTSAGDWRRWWDQNEKTFDPAAVVKKKRENEDRGTVLRRVEDRGEYEFLERLEKGDIVVVAGESDECETVLEALKLPFTLVPRKRAAEAVRSLDPRSVLVFDCEGDLDQALRGADAKALAGFVERGGYLFTSDWGLAEEIQPALPGFVGVGPTMPEEPFAVKIQPARGAEKHPYLRDVFPENPYERAKMKWTIDNSAFAIKLTPKATALVESPELGARFGSPAVAVTFRYGQGAVLHVMGHFKMQKDEKGDGFALQQLLVNFIVEKQKFRKKK